MLVDVRLSSDRNYVVICVKEPCNLWLTTKQVDELIERLIQAKSETRHGPMKLHFVKSAP